VRYLLWIASAGLSAACASSPPPLDKPPIPDMLGLANPRVPELAVTPTVAARAPAVAIVGATLLVGDGTRIAEGTVVLAGGRIVAMGPAGQVELPKDAEVIQARGKFVTPGSSTPTLTWACTPRPTSRATADGNEMTDPTTPVRVQRARLLAQDPADLSGASRAA
jgi:hypothetical protein